MWKFLENWYEFSMIPLRLFLGALFLYTGIFKAFHIAQTAMFLGGTGFPWPWFFTYVLLISEIIGAVLILFGFLTRYATVVLSIVILVALFTVHIKQSPTEFLKVLALLGGLLTLLIHGAGRPSIDEHFSFD